MGLTRLSTRGGKVIVGIDGEETVLESNEVRNVATRQTLETLINTKRSRALPAGKLFLHRNRNGRLALSWGEAPDVWPEDER